MSEICYSGVSLVLGIAGYMFIAFVIGFYTHWLISKEEKKNE